MIEFICIVNSDFQSPTVRTTALVGGTRSPVFPPASFKGFWCPALVHCASLQDRVYFEYFGTYSKAK